MKRLALVLFVVTSLSCPSILAGPTAQEQTRWEQEARTVTIIRDDWGIAHVYGKTDAAAVFGMIYAQAEDDFNRVETNSMRWGVCQRPRAREKSIKTCG